MTRCRPLLPLAGLVALVLAAPGRGDEQVPFKGHFLPVITSATPRGGTTLVDIVVEVTATATIIGKAQGPGSFVLDTFHLPDGFMTYEGETTWVTANGDSVHQKFVGVFIATDTPGLFENVEQFTIDGGTGRFAGATGEGVDGGQFDAITMSAPAPVPFEGTISSPGSLRK